MVFVVAFLRDIDIIFFFLAKEVPVCSMFITDFFFTPMQTGFWRDLYDQGDWRGRRPQGLAYER